MEGMRDLLKGTLRQTLAAMVEKDRLAAAWPVACGTALAGRGSVLGYANGVVYVGVVDAGWLRQMTSMRGQLIRELGGIAGLKVSEIHFELMRDAVQ